MAEEPIRREIRSAVVNGPLGTVGMALVKNLLEKGIETWAVCYPGDDSRHDFALKTQGFPHPYPAQTGNADTTTIDPELIIGKRKTVVDAFLAKLRITRPSGKEVFERCAQLHNRQLRCAFGDFKHPRELFPLDGVQLTAQGILVRFGQALVCLPCRILFLPLGQGPVIGETRRSCGAGEVCGLLVVGRERDFVGNQHNAEPYSALFQASSPKDGNGRLLGKNSPI